jgi:hypothetical protein
MKNLFNDLSELEKNRILEQHEGGKNLVIENFQKLLTTKLGSVKPLMMEQNDITEKETQELLGMGFKEVSEVNLPNGTYQMGGSGYRIDILSKDETDTGYRIILNQGIRGLYSGPIQIVNKKPVVDEINKIMFKDMGFKAVSQVKVTITPEMLMNSSIPQEVVSAPAPRFTISGGQGVFRIKGSQDLFGIDFSKYLSDINGEYYLFTETAEYLNQNKPNYGAKPKTQGAAFVNRATKSGKILYVGNKGLVAADFTA